MWYETACGMRLHVGETACGMRLHVGESARDAGIRDEASDWRGAPIEQTGRSCLCVSPVS